MFRKTYFHLVLIALIALIAYSNTFHVPFQFDDKGYIEDNPTIKDLGYFLEPSRAEPYGSYYSGIRMRYIGYLTFALNYRVHGLNVTGYHIVNLLVHILNAFLIYGIVLMSARALLKYPEYAALLTALVFVSHPVETEAVTYIFQRLASLATFFFLLSLLMYIKWRLTQQNSEFRSQDPETARQNFNLKSTIWYLCSIISAILAMKTKEIAFTLPLVILFYDFTFFRGEKVLRRILRLTPFLLTLFIIPLSVVGLDKPVEEIMTDMISATGNYLSIPGDDYLFTEFRVIVTYIRLLFFPINQNIDYDYPIFNSFFNTEVFPSFLFLLLMIIFAFYLNIRSKRNPRLCLVSFGILWFFTTISVESSIIPIPMVLNEYRVYLPSVGAFLAFVSGLFMAIERLKNKKAMTFIVLLMISFPLLFSIVTHKRNNVWVSELVLIGDAIKKSPEKARVYVGYANELLKKGRLVEAIEVYDQAIFLKPDYAEAYFNRGNAYLFLGNKEEATRDYGIHNSLIGRTSR